MRNILKYVSKAILIVYLFLNPFSQINANNRNPMLEMKLKDGIVKIELYPDVAPKHVARIIELIKEKFYDGLTFHRVIEGFVAQTGDPKGDGTGGSGKYIVAEFNKMKHLRGTLSMARAQDINSADSQFFICLEDVPHLDGNYTVFGKVISGMEFVDKIKKGNSQSGQVENPDKIISLQEIAN